MGYFDFTQATFSIFLTENKADWTGNAKSFTTIISVLSSVFFFFFPGQLNLQVPF